MARKTNSVFTDSQGREKVNSLGMPIFTVLYHGSQFPETILSAKTNCVCHEEVIMRTILSRSTVNSTKVFSLPEKWF